MTPPAEPTGFVARTGRKLKAAREAVGLTRSEVGERLTPPVPAATVRKWEEGRSHPTRDHRRQLCATNVLDVAMFDLWPPDQVADDLPLATARLLLRATFLPLDTVAGHLYVRVRPGERHDAARLLDLWLCEDCGPGRDHERILSVTGHGMDVLEEVGRTVG